MFVNMRAKALNVDRFSILRVNLARLSVTLAGKWLYQNSYITNIIYSLLVSLTGILFLAVVNVRVCHTGTGTLWFIQVHLVNSEMNTHMATRDI